MRLFKVPKRIPNDDQFFQTYPFEQAKGNIQEEQTFAEQLCQQYPDIDTWVKEHQSSTVDRKAFIDHLNLHKPPTKSKKMTLEECLGPTGFELYKAAINEEFNDPKFRLCIIAKAFKQYRGDLKGKIPIIPLGGPSGAGKSTSAHQLVARFIPENQDDPSQNHNFAMAFVDGGIPREVNNMHKIVKRYAELRGLRLSQFQKPSEKQVKAVKDQIRELGYAVAAAGLGQAEKTPVGVVEVETFSTDAVVGKKIYKDIIKKWDEIEAPKNVIMAIVGGDDPAQHPRDVRKMATYRSDPSDQHLKKMKANLEKYEWKQHAHEIEDLKEYKPYGEKGYVMGVTGSWKAALKFWNHINPHQGQNSFKLVAVENPVKPYHEVTGQAWKKGQPMQVASPQVWAEAMKDKDKPGFNFKQKVNELRQYSRLSRLVMHEVSSQHTSFHKLERLLRNQMDYNAMSSGIEWLGMQITRLKKKILKRLPKWVYEPSQHDWVSRNLPYTTQALVLGQKLNAEDYQSVVETRKGIEKIMEDKIKARSLMQKLTAFKSHLLPALKEIHRELKAQEIKLYSKRHRPIYHAQALAKQIGMKAETFDERQTFLQLALLGAQVSEIGKLLPASFVDYALDNITLIKQELDKNSSMHLSQQLIHQFKSYSEFRWFKTFETEFKPKPVVKEILMIKQKILSKKGV